MNTHTQKLIRKSINKIDNDYVLDENGQTIESIVIDNIKIAQNCESFLEFAKTMYLVNTVVEKRKLRFNTHQDLINKLHKNVSKIYHRDKIWAQLREMRNILGKFSKLVNF